MRYTDLDKISALSETNQQNYFVCGSFLWLSVKNKWNEQLGTFLSLVLVLGHLLRVAAV